MKYKYDEDIRRFIGEFISEGTDYWLESPFADCSSTFIKIKITPKKYKDLLSEGGHFYIYNLIDNQYTDRYGYDGYLPYNTINLGNDNSNCDVWIKKDSYVYDAKFDKFIQEFVSEIRDEVVVKSLIDN